eukprot:10024809-Lingulodinium_polyedra.AAC.1
MLWRARVWPGGLGYCAVSTSLPRRTSSGGWPVIPGIGRRGGALEPLGRAGAPRWRLFSGT